MTVIALFFVCFTCSALSSADQRNEHQSAILAISPDQRDHPVLGYRRVQPNATIQLPREVGDACRRPLIDWSVSIAR